MACFCYLGIEKAVEENMEVFLNENGCVLIYGVVPPQYLALSYYGPEMVEPGKWHPEIILAPAGSTAALPSMPVGPSASAEEEEKARTPPSPGPVERTFTVDPSSGDPPQEIVDWVLGY